MIKIISHRLFWPVVLLLVLFVVTVVRSLASSGSRSRTGTCSAA